MTRPSYITKQFDDLMNSEAQRVSRLHTNVVGVEICYIKANQSCWIVVKTESPKHAYVYKYRQQVV